jgi:hypothetical protein
MVVVNEPARARGLTTHTAPCPVDKKVLGGGWFLEWNDDLIILNSYPDNLVIGMGWRVDVINTNFVTPFPITVYAICAEAY